MKNEQTRSLSICVLGWTVVFANVLLYFIYYFRFLASSSAVISRLVSLISMLAVFPHDLFTGYFGTEWLPQMIWVLMVVACAFGILLLNKFARAVFIILNILQAVILAYLTFLHFKTPDFLDFIFKFYFTGVVSGSYIAYLVLPEVREQFHIQLEGLRLQIFLQKPLGKRVKPADAAKHASLSAAYLRLERYNDAVDTLKKAIEGDPDNANYYFQLAMVLIKQRLFSDAIKQLKEVIRLDPIYYEAYYNLGILYVHQGCSKEAAEIFLKAVHVRPEDPQAHRDLGDVYFSMGRYMDAISCFRKAISLSRKDSYAYYRMGCILTEYLGKDQEALEALRAAVSINQDFCDAHFHLGKVCIKMRRYKEAVRAFKDVVHLQEDHVQGHYHLGFVYAMLKDYSSARKQCQLLKKYDADLAENLLMLLSV